MESTHPRAEAVQAAVARYLDCGEEELRGLLTMGLSVADIVEWKGRSLDELERALAGVVGVPQAAGDGFGLVGQLMEVAEEGGGRGRRW